MMRHKIALPVTLVALGLMAGTADAQFTEIDAGLMGVSDAITAWVDYDNDGHLDLMVSGDNGLLEGATILYRNNGDGTFTENTDANLPGTLFGDAAWGDYNNNGLQDVLLLTGVLERRIRLFENNGDGSFTEIDAGLPNWIDGSVAWGDYDNDGFLDILITGYDAIAFVFHTRVYRNNGDGTFTDINAGLTGVTLGRGVWGDLTNNGYQDIVVTGSISPTSEVAIVYQNNGDGTFTDIGADLTPARYSSVAVGDFDNDGNLDLIVTGESGGVRSSTIYRNNGDGTFTDIGAGLPGVRFGSVDLGDFDNDGFLDILLTGISDSGAVSAVFRNNGDDTFTDIDAGLTAVLAGDAAWGDYDNDGFLDVVLAGVAESDWVAKVYHNGLSAPATVEELLEELLEAVAALRAAGQLNAGNANALLRQLGNVLRSYNAGNIHAACGQLDGFTGVLQGQINSGQLDEAEGQALLNTADAIRALLDCP